jgi:hypothetical protein
VVRGLAQGGANTIGIGDGQQVLGDVRGRLDVPFGQQRLGCTPQ